MDYKEEIIENVSDYLIWVKEMNNVESEEVLSFRHDVGYIIEVKPAKSGS